MGFEKVSKLPLSYRLALENKVVQNIITTNHSIYGYSVYSAQVDWGSAIIEAYEQYQDLPMKFHSTSSSIGTGNTSKIAISKAISESLERWAFFTMANCKHTAGFQLNRSTTGLAAYPRFSFKSARTNAFLEAAERWALLSWWRNELSHSHLYLPRNLKSENVKGIQIHSPIKNTKITVLYKHIKEGLAFGFSAAKSLDQSILSSAIELSRNERLLNRALSTESMNNYHIYERRLIYFCRNQDAFLSRLDHDQFKIKTPSIPKLLVDTNINGPWTRYAQVRRCLFRGTTDNKEDLNIFIF